MKKLLFLLMLTLVACEKNEDNNKRGCMCDVSYSVGDSAERFYYPAVPMDCNTREPLINLDERLPKGYKNLSFNMCNYPL